MQRRESVVVTHVDTGAKQRFIPVSVQGHITFIVLSRYASSTLTIIPTSKTNSPNNDTLANHDGNEVIDGGLGLDTVAYGGGHAEYTVESNNAQFTVNDNLGNSCLDQLSNVERLRFSDEWVALDLEGNAGSVAKLLGAVFGKESIANKTYAGIGLKLLDDGMSYEDLMAQAISTTGADTP